MAEHCPVCGDGAPLPRPISTERLTYIESAMHAPSVVAVAGMHSDIRVALEGAEQLLGWVRAVGEALRAASQDGGS